MGYKHNHNIIIDNLKLPDPGNLTYTILTLKIIRFGVDNLILLYNYDQKEVPTPGHYSPHCLNNALYRTSSWSKYGGYNNNIGVTDNLYSCRDKFVANKIF